MAIEIISGEQAWSKTRQKNKQKNWPSRQAAERLYPIATPITQATFKIHPDEKVFCIGSCFAGELSQALLRLNYNVLSIFHDLPKSPCRKISDDAMFHKYNVASIYNELSWALNPDTPYQHDYALIELSNNRFQDYQLSGQGQTLEPEFSKTFREAFNLAFAKVKEADVVILTLGLSEVWFDKQTQLYLNVTVPSELIKHYPQRFELHVFDYQQTLSYLSGIYDLLNNYLKSSFRLLVTVSPIPLRTTFRQQDVFMANAYSKAVLRTAVEEFVMDKDNVNYFPSYEFVTLSNPLVVWREDDFRHVDNIFVDYIMGNVMAQFTDAAPTIEQSNLLLKAKLLYHGNFLTEAKDLLNLLIKAQSNPDKELLLLWSSIQLGIKGKYKSLWLKAWAHLKTHRHLTIYQRIRVLLNDYRRLSNKSFIGHVELWDGYHLRGWACNLKITAPIQIKVLVDRRVVATVLADQHRADVAEIYGENHLHCGFYIPLDHLQLGSNVVRVVFADTGADLIDSPVYLDKLPQELKK